MVNQTRKYLNNQEIKVINLFRHIYILYLTETGKTHLKLPSLLAYNLGMSLNLIQQQQTLVVLYERYPKMVIRTYQVQVYKYRLVRDDPWPPATRETLQMRCRPLGDGERDGFWVRGVVLSVSSLIRWNTTQALFHTGGAGPFMSNVTKCNLNVFQAFHSIYNRYISLASHIGRSDLKLGGLYVVYYILYILYAYI